MDLELGHVNHQIGPKGKDEIRDISGVDPRPTPPASNVDELKALADADLGSSEQNVVGWHYDRFVPPSFLDACVPRARTMHDFLR